MQNNKKKIIKKNQKYANVLGVKLDSTPRSRLLEIIESDIKKNNKFYILTPNPELVMAFQEDEELKQIVEKAKIRIPDGVGLIAAHRFLNLPNPKEPLVRFFTLLLQGLGIGFSILFDRKWLERDLKVIRGREFFLEMVKVANKNAWKIYLYGGESAEAAGTKNYLEKKYKNIKIKTRPGPLLFNDGNPRTEKDRREELAAFKSINKFAPNMLFIGMTPPKQEKLMYRYFAKMNINCAMVVGGTFRYMTGGAKLPPKFMADAGLEWLWRLLTGSQKFERVVNAFPKFAFQIFIHKLTSRT